jgi:hypothetical protein
MERTIERTSPGFRIRPPWWRWTLIAEGFGAHVPKGYIYAAMTFSALIEGLNMLSRRATRRKAAGSSPELKH